ncbi:MAG: DUF2975 domain-containing protein [Flavobacterium sp.]|uniref:DUF2975 domain-containing protein n=1 Tax=Flavobacterium sp. TaxID=239 RepID=UPI00121CDD28|nr:DUF2975 domain-containing protein [Flavobacterium sp.]RZJ67482.1 MAG: DUF2975 domain-containing protein [Flavobacterium sp.]
MKRFAFPFLQAVLVFVGFVILAMMIWLPTIEGRAKDLDLVSIYSDPFILFAYVSSIAFFVALYNAISLLGRIGRNKLYTMTSIKMLRTIKICAILLGILIVSAGLYIRIFHSEDDDPAGFLAMCFVMVVVSAAVAVVAWKLEKRIRSASSLKS